MHPDDGRLKLIRNAGRPVRARDDVAAADIDLVGQGQRHGLTRDRALEIASRAEDAGDRALEPGGCDPDALAGANAAAHDQPGIAAKVLMRAVDPLHREAQRLILERLLHGERLEIGHERRALVPGSVRARGRDVVALERRDGDGGDVLEADPAGELAVLRDDAVEHGAGERDLIHLVDREGDPPDAEQREDVAVPAGLGEHPFARVDQHHGGLRGRRGGDHVARVLFVAGGVHDDELALLGREEAVRHVDGDALLALGGETIHEQRQVELAPLRPGLLRVGCERRELVLDDQLRVVQQPPDERRFAVVDAATGHDVQERLALLRIEVALDVGRNGFGAPRHQKYPSCFFFSIEAAAS